jgi:hypothetical protein
MRMRRHVGMGLRLRRRISYPLGWGNGGRYKSLGG